MSQFTQEFTIRPHALCAVSRRLAQMVACFNSRKYGKNRRRTVQMKTFSWERLNDGGVVVGHVVVKVTFVRRALSEARYIGDYKVPRSFRLFGDYDFSKAMRQLAKARA